MDDFRVETRRAVEADLPYLTQTWLRGYRSGARLGQLDPDIHRPVVADLLSRCGAYVAHPAGDPETILGYLVADPPGVVHWLYVRFAWRGNGIARVLVDAAGVTGDPVVFTHWTDVAAHLCRKYKSLVYYPFAVRGAL